MADMVRMVPIIIFGLFVKPGLSIRLVKTEPILAKPERSTRGHPLPENAFDHGLGGSRPEDTIIRVPDLQATAHSSSIQEPPEPDLHKVIGKAESTTNAKWLGDSLWAMAQREEGLQATDWVQDGVGLVMWPRSFVEKVQAINSEVGQKKRQFTFIGHIWKEYTDFGYSADRGWVVDFANRRFTDNDYYVDLGYSWKTWHPVIAWHPVDHFVLANGEHESYKVLGSFDHSKEWKQTYFNLPYDTYKTPQLKNNVEFDEGYFKKLAESEFTLCPAGDQPWSYRFLEAILAKSIPIVADPAHANCEIQQPGSGTKYTQSIGFDYYVLNEDPKFKYVYNETWAETNLQKALQHHTLMKEYGLPIDTRAMTKPRDLAMRR